MNNNTTKLKAPLPKIPIWRIAKLSSEDWLETANFTNTRSVRLCLDTI